MTLSITQPLTMDISPQTLKTNEIKGKNAQFISYQLTYYIIKCLKETGLPWILVSDLFSFYKLAPT